MSLDTEADSLHAYPEKVCLIQISIADEDRLVDPLCPIKLDPLLDALNAALMHGQMPADMRSTVQTALTPQTTARLKAQAALYLVASSSQYQVVH